MNLPAVTPDAKEITAYCVHDKAKVVMTSPERITMKNGKPAYQGSCDLCGRRVFRIGPSVS